MKKIILYLYLSLLILFVVFSYLFVDPNFFYLHSLFTNFYQTSRETVTVLYIIFLFLFFAFYLYFVRLGFEKKISLWHVVVLIYITTQVLIISYPTILSYDIFNYLATAKVLFHYHENPYILMPVEFLHDELLRFTHAANKTALYAPFWIFLTGIPYFLGAGKALLIIYNLKLLVAGFFAGTLYILWKISKNPVVLILFGMNPLVIIETFVSGHNDIVMMFLAVFSIYLFQKKKIVLSLLFFVLSILIKYSTIFLIPVFILLLWKFYRKEKIHWEKIYIYCFIAMLVIFLLSPIRAEIYPWYATWFLIFASLLPQEKLVQYFSVSISFGLMLRYVPFMLLGTYFGPTPVLKFVLMVIPIVIGLVFYLRNGQRKILNSKL